MENKCIYCEAVISDERVMCRACAAQILGKVKIGQAWVHNEIPGHTRTIITIDGTEAENDFRLYPGGLPHRHTTPIADLVTSYHLSVEDTFRQSVRDLAVRFGKDANHCERMTLLYNEDSTKWEGKSEAYRAVSNALMLLLS